MILFRLQPRTESFLRELTTNQCYNKEKLCEIWNQKSDCKPDLISLKGVPTLLIKFILNMF